MWRKHNGSLIFQDKVQFVPSTPSKYQRFENRTLVIFNVSHADEGEYSCELAPAPANGTSKVVHNVKIVKGPKIESITIKDSVKTVNLFFYIIISPDSILKGTLMHVIWFWHFWKSNWCKISAESRRPAGVDLQDGERAAGAEDNLVQKRR